MRLPVLSFCLAVVTLAALLAACGGSNGSNANNHNISALHDPKAAPTASAPAALSTPLIAGSLPAAGAAAASGGASGDTYVVASGDTLGAIADKNSISVAELEAFNPGVDPARLQIGQTLHIPKPGQTPGPSSTPTPSSTGAATTGGAPLSTPGPQPTASGGSVTIPPTGGAPNGNSSPIPSANASATSVSASGSATATAGASAGEYIVMSGDNACKIATNAKVTVQELAAANNLTVAALTKLTVGQVLKIPASTGHIGCT